MGIPVGAGWELKFYTYGNPGSLTAPTYNNDYKYHKKHRDIHSYYYDINYSDNKK